MAYVTENNDTGNGSKVLFSFTFPYLEKTDIKVSVDGTDRALGSGSTEYQFASATQIQFNTAPTNGQAVRIYRDTNIDNLKAEFFSGSAIRSQDLNEDFRQNLYNSQETEAAVANKFNKTTDLIDSTETWAASDSKIASTSAIDARVDSKLTTKVVDDIVPGTGVSIADNTPSSGKITINLDAELVELSTMATNTSQALADLTQAEVQILDGATVTTAELNKLDGVTASTTELNLVDGVTASTTELNILDGVTATTAELNIMDGVTSTTAELNILDGVTATTAELNYVDGVTSNIQTQLGTKQAQDDDLTSLSQMQTGAADKLKVLTADEIERIDGLTSSTAELNKLDGVTASATDLNITASMTKQTTISDTDSSYPTSGAVVDYVAAQISGINGVELIADDESFPNTLPAAGTVVSVSDAGGLTVNSSGVSTNGDTLNNTTVTINGFPSELRGGVGGNADPYTIGAGTGLLLKSTGSSQTYDYHQVMIRESDFVQLSDDINDFNSRYRIASSAPGSNNDEGDLYFDTSSNKMFVYDGSSWGEVTSTGDFKYLVLTETGTTNAASYDGSKVSFDLKENSTSGSAANVTNAAQLMVSINGVIQKPNTGTNTSGLDGFVMTDADTIKFTAGVPTGASVFVIQSGSALAINVAGDGTVTEAKLNANAPTNGHVLTADSTTAGGFKWAAGVSEGTDIKSTGESGGTKYLREDGDGTCSWQTVAQYTTPLTTRGDILFRDASGDQRLAKGTEGQYLKIGANDPEWADVVGAVADGCIFENDQTISNNYTIASGKGAHSVGPITVNATVTVNGNWVVS